MIERTLVLFVLVYLVASQTACQEDEMQLEFRMVCKNYCNEEKVQILNEWGVLYTEPVYVNNVDSETHVCLERTNDEMYILNLMDTANDRWDAGSYLTIIGEYGNVFYKGYMID